MLSNPRRLATAVALAVVVTAAAGCSGDSSTATTTRPSATVSAPSTSGPSTSSTNSPTTVPSGSGSTTPIGPAHTTNPTTGAGTPTSTAPPVVLSLGAATTNGVFFSPGRTLACMIGPNPGDQVRCASFSPTQLVTMTPDGTVTKCEGSSCGIGNPAAETKILPYGSATGDGTFTCVSSTTGFICTIASGQGFIISPTGIQSATP